MSILVTGGAGYIGSHTVLYLREQGEEIIVLDNFQTGHEDALFGTEYINGDIKDSDVLDRIFCNYNITAVIHFAASSIVAESMKNPLSYYQNNVAGTLNLVNKMVQYNVKKIVFSSTAATYGNPLNIPITENDPTLPTNPYGETKLAVEKMLKWAAQAYGLKSICLRYFNAAGADQKGRIGEDHHPETHLIPIVLQVALGQREKVAIFGDDYPTEDGTAIRDYVHVIDLAEAHYLALKYLFEHETSEIFNLGNGNGFSVKEVIETCQRITGCDIPYEIAERRKGDPPILVASSEKASAILGWKPKYPSLDTIVQHAWNWYQNHPKGYKNKFNINNVLQEKK